MGQQRGAAVLEVFAQFGLTVLEMGLGRYPEALGCGVRVYDEDPPGFGNRILPEIVEAGVRGGDRRAAGWLWSMQSGLKNAYESIKAFSETDFTEDLKKIDVPTLVLHGEDDQIVPVKDAAVKSAQLIRDAKEIYYPGAPHGLTDTHQDRFNADLLAFLRS